MVRTLRPRKAQSSYVFEESDPGEEAKNGEGEDENRSEDFQLPENHDEDGEEDDEEDEIGDQSENPAFGGSRHGSRLETQASSLPKAVERKRQLKAKGYVSPSGVQVVCVLGAQAKVKQSSAVCFAINFG